MLIIVRSLRLTYSEVFSTESRLEWNSSDCLHCSERIGFIPVLISFIPLQRLNLLTALKLPVVVYFYSAYIIKVNMINYDFF